MGVVIYIYLNHSLDNIDSKYVWVHVSNSLSSSVFAEIPILAFLALHVERERCGQVGPSPCYSKNEVVYAYKVLNLELQRFSGRNIIFFGFPPLLW